MTLSILLAATLATTGAPPPKAVFTFAAPFRSGQRSIVEEAILECQGDRCVGAVQPILSSQIRACRLLRRRFGPLVAITIDGKGWDADRLARCNAGR